MKNITFILLIFISVTSCELLGSYTPQQCAYSTFSFVDINGNDLFTDTLSVEDFQVTALKGNAVIEASFVHGNIHAIEVSFLGDLDDYSAIALFELKGYTSDTVVVNFKENKKEYFIKNLYYNNELYEDNNFAQCGSHWHKIIK